MRLQTCWVIRFAHWLTTLPSWPKIDPCQLVPGSNGTRPWVTWAIGKTVVFNAMWRPICSGF